MSNFQEFPVYDEVHVISDIHMGGKPGFQILKETKRLAGYVGWVAGQCPQGQVALVLNGDVFDTLAEDSTDYVAANNAVQVVQRIMDDVSFSCIWDALAKYVSTENRHLVFMIGNHDIEMAFPNVQRLIQWRLAGDDPVKRARLQFSTVGSGFTSIVGNAKVYCTHGNEVDAWNFNRYEDLAKVSRRINAGRTLAKDEWTPNAGTRMVKEVMNEIKRTYKWIDLLQPETKAAVSTLAVIDPAQASKITDLLSIVGDKIKGSFQVDQRLSVDGFQLPTQNAAKPVTLDQLLGPNVKEGLYQHTTSDVDEMLLVAEQQLGKPGAKIDQVNGSLGTGQLIFDRLTGWISGVGRDEALRRALKDWLTDDQTFNIENRDDTFNEVTKVVGSNLDFVITGHTHLERAIAMGGNRFYFNSGTWIRLLRFTDAMLKDIQSFKPVYDLLINQNEGMEEIDKGYQDAQGNWVPFVMDQTSAVSIKVENGKAVGCLYHIEKDGTGSPLEIKKFVKV
ncbi:MAG: metallophosphoesterase [Methylococcaceae bacterium]|nr:metallophosphoesterase [Methylococcaceae bacterium]